MLMFPTALKIYLAIEPVDMRKQFNGLWTLATERLREDPRQGAAFIFTNKDRDRLKILYWDGTGPWILRNAWRRSLHVAGGQRYDEVVAGSGSARDAAGRNRPQGRLQKSVVRTIKKLAARAQVSYIRILSNRCRPLKSFMSKTAP